MAEQRRAQTWLDVGADLTFCTEWPERPVWLTAAGMIRMSVSGPRGV